MAARYAPGGERESTAPLWLAGAYYRR
jgi:hypothetical protein